MAYFRQSKRRTSMFLEDLLGQPCCPSLAVKMENQVAAALRVALRGVAGSPGEQAASAYG